MKRSLAIALLLLSAAPAVAGDFTTPGGRPETRSNSECNVIAGNITCLKPVRITTTGTSQPLLVGTTTTPSILAVNDVGGGNSDVTLFSGTSGVQFAQTAFAALVRVSGSDAAKFQSDGTWRQTATGVGIKVGDRITLVDEAADALAQRNGTSAQAFRVYNTFTDASNYERGGIKWSSNVLQIGADTAAGTGTNRDLVLNTGGNFYISAHNVSTSFSYLKFTASGGNPSWLIRQNNVFGWSSDSVDAGNGLYAALGSSASGVVEVNNGTSGTYRDFIGRTLTGQTTLVAGGNATAAGESRIAEDSDNGSNYIAFASPSAITSNVTCTLENDANPIPDSCVGDGTDAGAGGGIGNVVEDTTPQLGGDLEQNGFNIIGSTGKGILAASDGFYQWNNDTTPLTSPSDDTNLCRSGAGIVFVGTTDCSTRGALETGTIELGAATDTTLARSAAGEATLEGDAVKHAGKQVMYIPAGAMKNDATSPASCGDAYDSGSNDVSLYVCAFDTGATEERADFGFAMPKAWNESTITYQVLWTNAAGASTETVQWEVGCAAISDDDTINTTMGTTVTQSDTWLAQNDMHITAESSALTIGGTPAENDYIACRISRDTSNDNMTGDALLIGIKIYWTDNAATLAE